MPSNDFSFFALYSKSSSFILSATSSDCVVNISPTVSDNLLQSPTANQSCRALNECLRYGWNYMLIRFAPYDKYTARKFRFFFCGKNFQQGGGQLCLFICSVWQFEAQKCALRFQLHAVRPLCFSFPADFFISLW